MATFITSRQVGQDIFIMVSTSTGYWKYIHNGEVSTIFSNGGQTIIITSNDGEFTLIPCLSNGTPNGNLTHLYLNFIDLTSFDGTGLSGLSYLNLNGNQLTSLDNLIFPLNLQTLFVGGNQLTGFTGTGLTSLSELNLTNNQLTSFDGTELINLTSLYLGGNQLTSLDNLVFPLNLLHLYLENNQLTSLDGFNPPLSLINLSLNNNQLTSFNDGETISNLSGGLNLEYNQLTGFTGTGLTSLANLYLNNNQLTSFDGTELHGLTNLNLNNNQLTSFDGTGLSGLTQLTLINNKLITFNSNDLSNLGSLQLDYNQLTGFTGNGLSNLYNLALSNNPLVSIDISNLSLINYLFLTNTLLNTETNDLLLSILASNQLQNGQFYGQGFRTESSDVDYDYLISNGWSINNLYPDNITFVTANDDSITIGVDSSTGYWLYNHNGVDSSVFSNGIETISVTNPNGEFRIISCDGDSTPNGDITSLLLDSSTNISVFNTIGLSGLTNLTVIGGNNGALTTIDTSNLISIITLNLSNNQLTSFDGTDLTNLQTLYLYGNPLTGFTGSGLTSLNELDLTACQLTSIDGFIFPTNLVTLYLNYNQLTGFTGTGLSGLTTLDLTDNPLISFNGGDMIGLTSLDFPSGFNITTLQSFDGGNMSGLTTLTLSNNQLIGFTGTGLTSLILLDVTDNQLTSLNNFTFPISLTTLLLTNNQLTTFDEIELINLNQLSLEFNQLSSINVTGLNSLQYLYVNDNLLTPQINDSLLSLLAANELNNNWDTGEFYTTGGRTAAGTTDYDYLISNGWTVDGADLAPNPTFITSKLTGETINISVFTTTGYWKYNHNSTDSSVFENGSQSIEVLNANGEFTLISCLSDGTPSGDITNLNLGDPDNTLGITSFDGTELTSLATLVLVNNSISSLNNFTFPTSLTSLGLSLNQLTGFTGTGLSSLTDLDLTNNPLTSFNGGDMIGLTSLDFPGGWGINTLQSFDGGNMAGLSSLTIANNQLTELTITNLSSLTSLNLGQNQLTSFDGMGLTNLSSLAIYQNQLTGFTGAGLSSLLYLDLGQNQLTSFDGTDLTNLQTLYLYENPLTGFTGSGLTSLNELDLTTCQLTSIDGFIFPTNLANLFLSLNQLTSFSGLELPNLIYLYLDNNQLTGFTGTGLTNLGYLNLAANDYQLVSFDGIGLSNLYELDLQGHRLSSINNLTSLTSLNVLFTPSDNYPFSPQVNDSILVQLAENENNNNENGGTFYTNGGRTSEGTTDYNFLAGRGWNLSGLDLISTARRVGIRRRNVTTTTTTQGPQYTIYEFDANFDGWLGYLVNDWDETSRLVIDGSVGIGKTVYYIDVDGNLQVIPTETWSVGSGKSDNVTFINSLIASISGSGWDVPLISTTPYGV